MAGKHNIVVDQGSTFVFDFNVATDGIAWNLSTYSATMQVRKSTSSADTLLDLSEANGDIVLTSSGGVTVTVDATTMADVPAGRWVYDFELTSAGNEVTRLLEGRFIVTPEVTQ